MRRALFVLLAVWLCLCAHPGRAAGAALSVASPAFKDGDRMARSLGCEGGDRSPALSIGAIPPETKTLALLMTEIDGPKSGAVLWMAVNIAPGSSGATAIADHQPRARQMKGEGVQLALPGGKPGYAGPCPPPGAGRRYQIEVFALDAALELPDTATKQQFLLAVEGHILASGKLSGRYKK